MFDMILEFDGGCEPVNPGGIAVGSFVLRDTDKNVLTTGAAEVGRYTPQATNNTAEFSGLLLGLETIIKDYSWPKHLGIFGDSEVVVKWFLQRNCLIKPNPKAPHLEPLKLRIRNILKSEDRVWTAEHVLREYNSDADMVGRVLLEKLEPFDRSKLYADHWWNKKS